MRKIVACWEAEVTARFEVDALLLFGLDKRPLCVAEMSSETKIKRCS